MSRNMTTSLQIDYCILKFTWQLLNSAKSDVLEAIMKSTKNSFSASLQLSAPTKVHIKESWPHFDCVKPNDEPSAYSGIITRRARWDQAI